MLEHNDVVKTETRADIDWLVACNPPHYAWKRCPALLINTSSASIWFEGEQVGRYMAVGIARKPGGSNFVTAGVSVRLLKPHQETLQAQSPTGKALKRLLAAVLLYKKVAETPDTSLISRVSFKFVDAL